MAGTAEALLERRNAGDDEGRDAALRTNGRVGGRCTRRTVQRRRVRLHSGGRPAAKGGLTALVDADKLAASEGVSAGGCLDFADLRAACQTERLHVECEQFEMVMVRSVSLGRARAAVPGFAQIVHSLRSRPLPGGDRARPGGNVI